MEDRVQCPRGHWFTSPADDAPIGCPHCAAQSALVAGKTVSEDDILAILGPAKPTELAVGKVVAMHPAHALGKSKLHRRKKICTGCETPLAFEHCPRCSMRLETAPIGLG